MSNEATSGQEPGDRTDIEITVCSNGVVNVHRPESDRAHSVFVDDGDVVRCSCKGHKFHGRCAHQDVIESRPLILASATAAASSNSPAVATDGGATVDDSDDGRERPTRSEPADFGGGEESGMDDLGGTPEINDTDARRDDAPETCDHCGEPPELTLTDMSDSDWNDFEQLCTSCVLDVGGPGEAPDGHNTDDGERGTTDVSPCPGCGAPTTGDTCGRARCEGADEIDEAPL